MSFIDKQMSKNLKKQINIKKLHIHSNFYPNGVFFSDHTFVKLHTLSLIIVSPAPCH